MITFRVKALCVTLHNAILIIQGLAMLSVAFFIIILSVVVLCVIMLRFLKTSKKIIMFCEC